MISFESVLRDLQVENKGMVVSARTCLKSIHFKKNGINSSTNSSHSRSQPGQHKTVACNTADTAAARQNKPKQDGIETVQRSYSQHIRIQTEQTDSRGSRRNSVIKWKQVQRSQEKLQSAPAPPMGSQYSCQPTVKLHILP